MPVTPNMGLVLPTPTVTPGPTYATENNSAFSVVDSHNHTPGYGLQVPVAGLNINADLPLAGNNLTLARSLRLQIQGSPLSGATDLACLYSSSGELYYNDGSGNQVQITLAGAVDTSASGTITGMGATTATASYSNSTKTFTFNQNTNQRADMDIGQLVLRDPSVTSANGVTLQSPTSLASGYSVTFPASLPVSNTKFLQIGTGGNLYCTLDVDNSTLQISGSTLQVPTGGITTINGLA